MEKRNFAGYLRVSTLDQAILPEGSLKSQKFAIEEYLKLMNKNTDYTVNFYIDEAMTGRNVKRPALQKMLNDIKAGYIYAVISTEISRISRSIVDLNEIVKVCKINNVGIIIIREGIDTTKDVSMLTLNIMGVFAQNESDKISERVRAGNIARKKRGLYVGRKTLGYVRDNGSLRIINDEAVIVNLIFEKYLEIGSCFKVTKWLNDHGFTNLGRKWDHCAIFRLLNNLSYIAKIKFGDEIIMATWQPIIKQELWDKVQMLLSENKKHRKNVIEKCGYCYIFAGLLFCPTCNCYLVTSAGTGKSKKVYYYYCHPQNKKQDKCELPTFIRADVIDENFLSIITKGLADKNLIMDICNKVYEKYSVAIKKNKEKLSAISNQIDNIDHKAEKITEKLIYLTEQQIIEFVKPQLDRILLEKDALKHTREEEEKRLLLMESRIPQKEDIVKRFKSLDEIYKEMDVQKKRSLIRLLICRIDLGDNISKCFLNDGVHGNFDWRAERNSQRTNNIIMPIKYRLVK